LIVRRNKDQSRRSQDTGALGSSERASSQGTGRSILDADFQVNFDTPGTRQYEGVAGDWDGFKTKETKQQAPAAGSCCHALPTEQSAQQACLNRTLVSGRQHSTANKNSTAFAMKRYTLNYVGVGECTVMGMFSMSASRDTWTSKTND
jgi:hypothetical protein